MSRLSMLFERLAPACALGAVVAGCVGVRTTDGEHLALTSPAFRAYVERVFREQNRLADELAFAIEAGSAVASATAAEQLLLEACAGVNELATARRDGTRLGVERSADAARSVPQCEAASRAAEAALAEVR